MKSILEKGNRFKDDVASGICYGRITKVYPEERMCEVKVFGRPGMQSDTSIPKCQWISADANPDGDESSTIPRINSYGLVAYVDGEAFILGFFRPLNAKGTANVAGDQEELNEGDKVIKTVGKNKIILRASGEIQVESTRTCRTIWFPERHLLNVLCRNYEFRTDGGTVDWTHIDENSETTDTVKREEVRDNINRSNIVLTETGTVQRGSPTIYRRQFGQGVDGDDITAVVHTTEIKNTGETDIFVRAPNQEEGFKANIKPSSETTVNIAGKVKLNIQPTGETDLNVNDKANIHISPSGETLIDVGPGKSTILMKASGEIEVTTSTKVKVTSPKVELNGAASGITTMNSHQGVVDFITGVPITPSTTVFSDI